ncbi:HAD-superfamily hydrolase, subfamily IIB [Halobacteroides halobius DSM 5150]|uniref:HAD-superfamily hydrolase, subfamily IIB n=1 Tax=Halobacteroides halobius (strain ATCC 35273 / DSM 5150 / MD-1) TaxID=748449 RepID=L0KD48_HALHC|nr:Cof-type HAD-IIB family hydrolase [Halobacteroides halobius]AGB42013.1 HAD-superfamily hydrolase, subfamily IIB [Halobacteroides halobius DSM 5150]
MNYKLLAIDLDDTLLGQDLKISNRTQKLIKEARKQGLRVVIATGRMYSSALPYLKQLNLTKETITYNGALVKQVASNKIIDHRPVPKKLARKIVDYVEENNLHLNLYLDDQLYVNKSGFGADYYERISGVKPTLIKGKLSQCIDQPSTKLLIVEENLAKVKEVLVALQDRFSDDLNVTASKAHFVEIMNQQASKGRALKKLASDLNIERDQIIAIGDSYNDLDMIEYAGFGVAVDNARDKLKEKADYITSSNDEGGVAEIIEKFILN